jgi:hypothetical protein
MRQRPVNPLSPHFQGEVGTPRLGWFPTEPPPPPDPPAVLHSLGLDLGQCQDFSALVVVEYPDVAEPTYDVRHVHRWSLGTSYKQIAADVTAMLGRHPLGWHMPLAPKPEGWVRPTLAVDRTGVGNACVEFFDRETLAADLHEVLITAGHAVSKPAYNSWHVAKVQLVSVLQQALQAGRLRVAQELEMADVLVRELKAFKVKITAAGNLTMESWREKDHDDIVLALCMALFVAESRSQAVLDAHV